MNCLIFIQQMRKNKVLYDAAMKQMDVLLPDKYRDANKKALEICKDAANGEKNACDAGSKMIECIHKNNPIFRFV